jgi:hypothetical protein
MVVMAKPGLTNIYSTYLCNFVPGKIYTLWIGLSEVFKVLCKKPDDVTWFDDMYWLMYLKSNLT